MSYKHITYEVDKDSHIATVTLNKPERLNAIDSQDHQDILELCERIQSDDDVWVVIWTGAGRGFCSGADVGKGPTPRAIDDQDLNELLAEDSWISRQGKALYAIDKPMLAAINGVAAGAGFSLALCCDMRIGCSTSRFITVYQERSLPPEGGMSFLLSRIVGLSRAMDLSLTSRRVDADEAYRIGLLDRLVDDDELMPVARQIAERMCELPPAAVRVSKRAIRAGLEASFEAAGNNEVRYGGMARRARHDAEESIKAFAEKRKPEYKGR
jgi:2-(1,2-epoxy-1,2-dihydrophenyl)acetyl-CoA isomerase